MEKAAAEQDMAMLRTTPGPGAVVKMPPSDKHAQTC